MLAHRDNRDRWSCWLLFVSQGTYKSAFLHRLCIHFMRDGAKGSSSGTTLGEGRWLATNIHHFAPTHSHMSLVDQCFRIVFSCLEQDTEALTGASNLILWDTKPGPQCGHGRAVLHLETLPTGGHFVHPSHRRHSEGEKMVPGPGHTEWRHKFWTSRYSSSGGGSFQCVPLSSCALGNFRSMLHLKLVCVSKTCRIQSVSNTKLRF